jgi:tetratricopeptide (TPR) repeat protein
MKAGLIRSFRRLTLLLLIGLLGWWGYTTFLSPSNAVIIRNRVTKAATVQVIEHNWEAALATVSTGLEALPNDWELLVWQSALLEKQGRSGQASLAQAEKQAAQLDVWITLGQVATMIEWPQKTLAVGDQLVALAPELPHGYFFQAKAYESEGQSDKALRAYDETQKRAADNPDYHGLYVAARERIFALSTFQR